MRWLFVIMLLFCIGIVFYVIYNVGTDKPETWAVVVAVFAVISSIFSADAAQSTVKLEQKRLEPQILAYIDHKSRRQLFLFCIKNVGGSPAYDVSISWTNPLYDRDEKVVKFVYEDGAVDIPILLPDSHLSKTLDAGHAFMKKYEDNIFTGFVSYKDGIGKKYKHNIYLSVKELMGTPLHTDESSLSHEAIQKIPKVLETNIREISFILKRMELEREKEANKIKPLRDRRPIK